MSIPLTRPALMEIITRRGWERDACFLDESTIREDVVVFEPRSAAHGTVWDVYLTLERAFIQESTRRTFETESGALDHMLLKLEQSERARRRGVEVHAHTEDCATHD
ncbi:hypothetical protein [Ruania halotolerans]|uniref:hypothetical protein n=1 Tax=Ruania halotolerans TaxID=2897773 RepID=UPI001E4A17F7|nr:hypothetical protein [Ruania halotolerans]UFU05673.1 hypothetical protein LQF10_14665 [Ruania halotolerans]